MKKIILAVLFFLSSPAEASHGDVTKPLTVYDTGIVRSLSAVDSRLSALIWAPARTAFERLNPPVAYIVEWPHLPSIAETHIFIARQKLAEYTAHHAQEAQEKRKAMEMRYDWEAFWKAMGLALMIVGGFFTLIYGRGPVVFDNRKLHEIYRPKKNRV